MKPTPAQIIEERKRLLRMMPKIRRFSAFGDDHHEAIKAVMHILDGRATADLYEGSADNVRDEACNAQDWMNGEADPEYVSPSENWKGLLIAGGE